MRDELLEYYERELSFLRRTGASFAEQYPKIASRLALEPTKCDDPHVERLLEGFAFLAARVHLKLDDDFSEFGQALLDVVFPHYTRPIPSMSLVQFHLDPEQGKLTSGLAIPRDTLLYSRPVGGATCRFSTCYDTTLWPVRVADAAWQAPHDLTPPVRAPGVSGVLRLELETVGDVTFADLEMDTLRLHLHAESALASTLYEVLCNNCVEILVRTPGKRGGREPIRLPPSALRPVGFEHDEGMLPPERRAFVGYRLLLEYFAFPEKFFFLDLSGLDQARTALGGSRLEVLILLSSFERNERRAALESGVTADTIRLGCTPIVNLFPQASEPIQLTQRQHEYVVVADARRRESVGVFSVEDVVGITSTEAQPIHFGPLYSLHHGDQRGQVYWRATRRPAGWRTDGASDVYLSFVDAAARMADPATDSVTAHLQCHNGGLPARLPFGDGESDFQMTGGGPVNRVEALIKPTEAIEPPGDQSRLWRLISLLSLNYVSLVEGGPHALREILALHNFGGSPAGEKQIQGILSVNATPTHARIVGPQGIAFARGHRVELEFDEEQYVGGGVYLMASVLERFLALYVSLNSFCTLAIRTRQRKELLREWAPRVGWKTLI